jgi:hypothetical protein
MSLAELDAQRFKTVHGFQRAAWIARFAEKTVQAEQTERVDDAD